jgi:hypothetical protein
LRAVLEARHPERLVLCDTWDNASGGTGRGSNAHIRALLTELGYGGGAVFLDGRSQDLLPAFAADNPWARFDLVNVDGSHDYADTLADLEVAWPLTDLMVIHDTSLPSVWKAVREFGAVNEARVYAAFGDQGTAVFDRRKAQP